MTSLPASHERKAGRFGVAQLPGFEDSLRLLVTRERYSFEDIGFMFGVTRERVRQLCLRYGIEHPDTARGLLCVREWCDETNTFRPTNRSAITRRRSMARTAERRARIAAKNNAQRAAMLTAAHSLRAELGRIPFWRELGETIIGKRRFPSGGGYMPYLLNRWRLGRSETTAQARISFIAALGFEPLDGRRGHVRLPLSSSSSRSAPSE